METKDLSYAEQNGKKPFDWYEFLNKETYIEEELKSASLLAADWVTCACGNLCAEFPRFVDGTPTDDKLKALGFRFTGHISNMSQIFRTKSENEKWNEIKKEQSYTLDTLEEIEIRSAELLKEIKS